jgi:hypothetical protein
MHLDLPAVVFKFEPYGRPWALLGPIVRSRTFIAGNTGTINGLVAQRLSLFLVDIFRVRTIGLRSRDEVVYGLARHHCC